jgi:hypothetical protein
MNMRTRFSNPLARSQASKSNALALFSAEDTELTSHEIRRCARLFDEYNRPECAIFFVELLVTPQSERAEKIKFSSEDLWKKSNRAL